MHDAQGNIKVLPRVSVKGHSVHTTSNVNKKTKKKTCCLRIIGALLMKTVEIFETTH